MIHHRSPFKKCWDVLILVILAYMVVATPFTVAFSVDEVAFTVIGVLIDAVFIADLILNFLTTFDDENRNLVTDREAIAWAYLYGWFWIDLVSSIPVLRYDIWSVLCIWSPRSWCRAMIDM